jgi:hypothetical protein
VTAELHPDPPIMDTMSQDAADGGPRRDAAAVSPRVQVALHAAHGV